MCSTGNSTKKKLIDTTGRPWFDAVAVHLFQCSIDFFYLSIWCGKQHRDKCITPENGHIVKCTNSSRFQDLPFLLRGGVVQDRHVKRKVSGPENFVLYPFSQNYQFVNNARNKLFYFLIWSKQFDINLFLLEGDKPVRFHKGFPFKFNDNGTIYPSNKKFNPLTYPF